jgi:hypothetical protein
VVAAPAHIVIVMMENHSYGEVIGNPSAPFLNGLAARGALFTNSIEGLYHLPALGRAEHAYPITGVWG